ncbi:hypothetical protein ACFCZY_38435 [Streptomyces sp. NPDC056237]|uniref:hypothetical protein n=1 Tax=unclassified Streptomyces TaxID=2593676 RepID=UPI0035DC8293
MAPIPVDPRPLNEAERSVLKRILSVEFEGASELRSRVDLVEVVAVWSLDSTSVDFRVRNPALRSSQREGHVPVAAEVVEESGEYVGELLVWLTDGVLSALEYAWVTDEMPTVLPTVEMVHPRCHG